MPSTSNRPTLAQGGMRSRTLLTISSLVAIARLLLAAPLLVAADEGG
jgi:hypothetical protein